MRGRTTTSATTARAAAPARGQHSVVGLLDDAMAIGRPDAAIDDADARGGALDDDDDEEEEEDDDALDAALDVARTGSLDDDVVRRSGGGASKTTKGTKRRRATTRDANAAANEENGVVFQLPGRAVRSSKDAPTRVGRGGRGVGARAASRRDEEEEESDADDDDAPEGWRELCERGFSDKKEARVHVVEWYSRTSASSSKLIIDKWRESRVRYVLRCQRAVPKRQEKSDVDACQRIGSRCPLCINIRYDKLRNVWRVRRSESTPTHDASCIDTLRPNVSSTQFAEALRGIGAVPPSARHEFVSSRLRDTGYTISAGTKQRAVALALKRESAD